MNSKEEWRQLRLPIRVARRTEEELIESDPLEYLRKAAGRRSKIFRSGNLSLIVFRDLETICGEGDAYVDIWETTDSVFKFREGYIVQTFAVTGTLGKDYLDVLTNYRPLPTGVSINQAAYTEMWYAQATAVAEYVKEFVEKSKKESVE